MFDLDSVKGKKKKIRAAGKVIELDLPTLDTMIEISEAEKLGTMEQLIALKSLLVQSGLPKALAGKLDGDQIMALTKHLKEDSKKK